jgi:hypothetical protein
MNQCDHVITIEPGKAYEYCDNQPTSRYGTVWLCQEHGGYADEDLH